MLQFSVSGFTFFGFLSFDQLSILKMKRKNVVGLAQCRGLRNRGGRL